MSELERALEFLAVADHGGTRRHPYATGTALFDERLPRRWDSNYLLVERVPDRVGAAELAAEAERIQGRAGLQHRKLELHDEEAGARLEPQFRDLGWSVNRHVLMALRREADRSPDRSLVREVDAAALREARAEQLRGYDWAAEPEVLDQLHAAKAIIAEVVETRFFAVVVNRKSRQLDEPLPSRRHGADRGRRDGRKRAGKGLRERGHTPRRRRGAPIRCRLIFLVADDEDWPKELYRKLGLRRARPRLRVPARLAGARVYPLP